MADFTKSLIAYARDKGFIWGPSPEMYGGLSGFYEYGPLGKLLKNNIEDAIRTIFSREEFWEVECPTIMPAKVWEASGHLSGFTDPLVEDVDGGVHRADHLIEEYYEAKGVDPAPILAKNPDLMQVIKDEGITAPNGKALKEGIKNHNLMLQTTVGLGQEAYNRPETATTTYLPFTRYFDHFRKKLPFGVFQIGKAYRNEISPRQFTMRLREFTQAEAQLFLFKDQKDGYPGYDHIKDDTIPLWSAKDQEGEQEPQSMTVKEAREQGVLKNDAYAYTLAVAYRLFTSVGLPEDSLRLRQHGSDEKAFYADDAWDVEIKLKSFGWMEICGVHDRTDYDLTQHQKHSKKKLGVSDEDHKKELPHILEIAFGTDRVVFSLLDSLFDPQAIEEGKTTLRIPARIAPIKAAVYPLVKKDGMPQKARALYKELSQDYRCVYDESASVGKRYLRASELGVPYAFTIDGETLKKGTVTIRDRDTEEQRTIKLEDAHKTLRRLLRGEVAFSEL